MLKALKRLIKKSDQEIGNKPNIIMILLDQFRNDSRICHPIFEKLKKRGVLFSQVITYAPYTLGSLHATFSGMYGRYNGVDGYARSQQYDKNNCLSITEYLRAAGYHTRAYSFSPILFPHPGFDLVKIVCEDEEPNILESHSHELQECFGQKKPFFQYLHYGEIHHSVVKNVIKRFDDFDQEYFGKLELNREKYNQYAYQAGVYLDRLIRRIEELDPEYNSLIIVTTDHGGGIGEKPGEKAYGIFTYDYTLRVWLYLISPKLFPANKEFTCQVRTIDIMPTIMDILNIERSKKHKPILGKSLLPIVRGEEASDRIAFSETGGVDGPYPSPDKANVKCIRDGKWKLIYNTTTSKMELYNLISDPNETENLYNSCPDKRQDLWLKLTDYL